MGSFSTPKGKDRGVFRIDPTTGAQTLLQTGVFGNGPPQFIAIDRHAKLYASMGNGSAARIARLDLGTGVLDDLTTGDHLNKPRGIAIDQAGDLLVTDEQVSVFPPSDAILLRIDAETGEQTVIAQNVFLSRPKDLALDIDGTAIVVDDTLWGGVFRVDPLTGAVITVSENQQSSLIPVATYVGIAPGGAIFVNGPDTTGLVRVDPGTGEQFLSLQGLPLIRGIKNSLDGDLFLALGTPGTGTIRRFDPDTETILGTVTSGGPLGAISSIAVVPAPVEPPEVSCALESGLLWPPNHELLDVGLGVSVAHDAPTTLTVAVYSDEDDSAPGSGRHAPDAVDVAVGTLRLRAERSGSGDGRVYLIVARAEDKFGNVGFDCCTVVVPSAQDAESLSSVHAQAAAAEAFCDPEGAVPPNFVPVGEG
ncbi:MAG: hypothetical protein ACKVXR_18020 [Planctomycetota bacterium]